MPCTVLTTSTAHLYNAWEVVSVLCPADYNQHYQSHPGAPARNLVPRVVLRGIWPDDAKANKDELMIRVHQEVKFVTDVNLEKQMTKLETNQTGLQKKIDNMWSVYLKVFRDYNRF